MAYLARRKGGWLVRWREGGRGAPSRCSELLPTKADAQRRLELVEAELARRLPVPAGAVLAWPDLIARWSDAMRAAGRSDRYIAEVVRLARVAAAWPPLHQLTRAHLTALRIGELRLAKAVLGWARRELGQPVPDILDARPARRAVRRPQRPLVEASQVAAWLDKAAALAPGGAAIAHLVATYGHRAASLVGLRRSAFDLDGQPPTLTLPVKGGDTIRHPLLPVTVALLRPLVESAGPGLPVLRDQLGRPWADGRAYASWWKSAVTGGAGYYDLKRYAISGMLAAGADPITVASITGHRTVSLLLNTYGRTNEARQMDALGRIPGAHLVRTG